MALELVTAVGDHLWQSTLVAVVVAALAVALRHNRASVRHTLWLAVSLKFAVPFALLTAVGQQIEWRDGPAVSAATTIDVETVVRPFSAREAGSTTRAAAPAGPGSDFIATVLVGLWAIGAAVVGVSCAARWRRVARIVHDATPLHAGRVVDALTRVEAGRLSVVASNTQMEPGVFGVRTPVLVWPRDVERTLTDPQLDAIAAHELAHVRRGDNRAALLHLGVQAVFWFHPLVWWIGRRLVEECERACDEAVVEGGNDPDVYAEGILKTCRFCVESPLACIAGVSGADLQARIARIVRNTPAAPMTPWRRTLIITAAAVVLAAPIGVGIAQAPARATVRAVPATLKFDVASVKGHDPDERGRVFGVTFNTGRLRLVNLTLGTIVRAAYGVSFPHSIPEERVSGGPDWLETDRFTIEAAAGRPVTPSEMAVMLRNLLADRFKLVARVEPRQLPIFALVTTRPDGRLGPQLRRSEIDCTQTGRCGIGGGPGRFRLEATPMALLAESLTELTDRPVFDRTGLEGSFDGTLEWTPTPDETQRLGGGDPSRPPTDNGPSLFTALQEQLGLRLSAERGPVDFLVIERAHKPTEN